MEEKRYPIIDEEEGLDRACEPIVEAASVTARSNDGVTTVDDEIEHLDWDRFPSFGPFSDEEAIARIDEFESELEKGQVEWISSEQVWGMLYQKYPWLR